MIHKAFSSRTLIDVSHPDLLMARLQLPWLCQSRGFNEKTQRRRKTRRTEPGNVYSSIDSSKIVHFFFFFFFLISFNSRRTVCHWSRYGTRTDECTFLGSSVEKRPRWTVAENEDPPVPSASQPVSEAVRLSEIPCEPRSVGYSRRPIT